MFFLWNAVAIWPGRATWPVTGKVFKILNDRQSCLFSKFHNSKKNPAKPNYHMSIKKSQAILKCFIDLKNIAFGSPWAQKTKPCFVTYTWLFSARLPLKVSKTLNDRQSYIVERLVLKDLKGCWFLFLPSFPKTNTLLRNFYRSTFSVYEVVRMACLSRD